MKKPKLKKKEVCLPCKADIMKKPKPFLHIDKTKKS